MENWERRIIMHQATSDAFKVFAEVELLRSSFYDMDEDRRPPRYQWYMRTPREFEDYPDEYNRFYSRYLKGVLLMLTEKVPNTELITDGHFHYVYITELPE